MFKKNKKKPKALTVGGGGGSEGGMRMLTDSMVFLGFPNDLSVFDSMVENWYKFSWLV